MDAVNSRGNRHLDGTAGPGMVPKHSGCAEASHVENGRVHPRTREESLLFSVHADLA